MSSFSYTGSQGARWYYEIEGRGPGLVFLHGWGVNGRVWRQQVKYFCETHTVLTVDLPGHGRSEWRPMKVQHMADDLTAVMSRHGLKRSVLVGSSFGGLIALGVVQRAPENIRGLALVGSQPKFARSPDYPYGLETARIKKLAQQVRTDYPSIVHVFFRSLFTRQERASRRYRWLMTFRKTDIMPQQEALLGLLRVLEESDFRDALTAVRVPLMFLYGEDDQICSARFYETLKEQLPHARFFCFKQSGHFPFLSRPHEFNDVLGQFLSSLQANEQAGGKVGSC